MNMITSTLQIDRANFLNVAAEHFANKGGENFTAAARLETLSLEKFRQHQIGEASIFSELEKVLQDIGLSTDGTFGCLTDRAGFTQEDAHKIGCSCNGQMVSGTVVAQRLRMRIAELN